MDMAGATGLFSHNVKVFTTFLDPLESGGDNDGIDAIAGAQCNCIGREFLGSISRHVLLFMSRAEKTKTFVLMFFVLYNQVEKEHIFSVQFLP
ncbi:MAG: hypothetical protein [Circular genetic element sp.]|nr:MAG: hypothetical protein [Circular genetic element sp.]